MCRQIGFALRATTKRGGLPSGFAAGTARRRFDLKVELQAIRLPFDIQAPSTFVKRRHAMKAGTWRRISTLKKWVNSEKCLTLSSRSARSFFLCCFAHFA